MTDLNNKIKPRWIKPLPERVINKIAAGEVIERPAAVVKELVENAIDSSADNIQIIIEKSGTKLIKIIDNGCGISEDQIEIAFSRHATSKISSFDDLNALYTYGFRGEALPSIASISRLRMVSRPHDADVATEIIYEGGVLLSKEPVAAPRGTSIEVENIFFNTPVRRKFLKAETTESRQISRTAMGMAIGRADIGFSFSINGKNIFSLNKQSNLKDRISGVLGAGKKLIKIDGESEIVKVSGYVGNPETFQQNRNGQFLFINNRLIQSPTISHALIAGFGEMIPRGRFPIGALLLTVELDEVDVNVHPTKAEVRLSKEKEIHDAVYRIVRDSLRQDGLIPSYSGSDFSDNQKAQSSFSTDFNKKPANNNAVIPGIYNQKDMSGDMLRELYKTPMPDNINAPQDIVQINRSTGEVIEAPIYSQDNHDVKSFRYVGRFSDLYILMQSGDDLYIVDQHTAHERVLYEETLKKIENSNVEGQSLLFPEQVELDPQQMALFEEVEKLLNESGFTVAQFGGRTVNIEAVPAILRKKSPLKLFVSILDDIASLKKSGQDIKKSMAQSIACRSAVMAGDRLSDEEAHHLLKRLNQCDDKYICPHGRPTFVRLSKKDLDKQFGR